VHEYLQWVNYRNQRGSLAVPRRLEQSIAQLCQLVTMAAGLKNADGTGFSVIDFMPHEKPPEQQENEQEITFAEFVSRMK
jgi:hypothetical protein